MDSDVNTPYSGKPRHVKRKQRYPQYSPVEMERFFKQVAMGYPWPEAASRCHYIREWVRNTLYSHDSLMDRLVDEAMKAGARIRAGELKAPDRADGLYDIYR